MRTGGSRVVFSLLILTLFSVLILGYLWVWRFSYFHQILLSLVYAGCAALVALTHALHPGRRRLGLRLDNLVSACRSFAPPVLGLSLLILLAGLRWGEWIRPHWKMILPYFGWALLQQHVLQNFLKLHVSTIAERGGRVAWTGAAGLFALYHLPNPWLVGFSFLLAWIWCAVFEKAPNLFAAAAGQTLLTVTLVGFFKFGFIAQLEVGAGGLRFEQYGDGVKVAGGHLASGEPFVAALPGSDRDRTSRVRVFVPGSSAPRFEWVAFPEFGFSGEIAAGDLGYGPGDEIVVTPGPGPSNPAVAGIFSPSGRLLKTVAAPWTEFGYGARPAVACGRLYLGAGPGPLAPPRLAEISAEDGVIRRWAPAGLELVNGLRGTRICDPANPDSELRDPDDLLLWGSEVPVNPGSIYRLDARTGAVREIPVFNTTFGLNVTLLKAAGEVLAAGAPGPLRGYSGSVSVRSLDGAERRRFITFEPPDSCGANLSAVDWDGDGVDELVAGQGNCPGSPPEIQIWALTGERLAAWMAY